MTNNAAAARRQRVWNGRFMKAIAVLEEERHRQERCGGCGLRFGDHSDDYAECVRKVLALNDET
jgi:hypothetical protein